METLPIINRTYDVYKSVSDITGHTEKRWRYSLGSSLEESVLNCLGELIMAKNAPKPLKSAHLLRASAHNEVAVLKLRLLLEFKAANETKIFQTQHALLEVGRMLGGWIKSLNTIPTSTAERRP